MYIYEGPYPPLRENEVADSDFVDPSTAKRKSLCAETRGAADLLAVQLRRGDGDEMATLTGTQAPMQWIDEKRPTWRNPDSVARSDRKAGLRSGFSTCRSR